MTAGESKLPLEYETPVDDGSIVKSDVLYAVDVVVTVAYPVVSELSVIVLVAVIVTTVVCSTAVATLEVAVKTLTDEPSVTVKVAVIGTVRVVVAVAVENEVTFIYLRLEGAINASLEVHSLGVTVTVTVLALGHVESIILEPNTD